MLFTEHELALFFALSAGFGYFCGRCAERIRHSPAAALAKKIDYLNNMFRHRVGRDDGTRGA